MGLWANGRGNSDSNDSKKDAKQCTSTKGPKPGNDSPSDAEMRSAESKVEKEILRTETASEKSEALRMSQISAQPPS